MNCMSDKKNRLFREALELMEILTSENLSQQKEIESLRAQLKDGASGMVVTVTRIGSVINLDLPVGTLVYTSPPAAKVPELIALADSWIKAENEAYEAVDGHTGHSCARELKELIAAQEPKP